MLQNQPWFQDVEEELTWIDEEKKKAMEEFGNGLFDEALGANAGANKVDDGNGGGVNDEQ